MNDYTIIVPTRNQPLIANEFLRVVLSSCEFNIILIDDNSETPLDYITHERISIIENKEKKSLTKLWNQGIKLSQTDNLIICSHKVRPDNKDFQKIDQLLNEGYGLVAISGFHFFSFNKFLCTKIGMFDEGFTTGWFEDNDFLNKLVVNNISYYLSEEVNDIKGPSGWEHLQLENRNYYFSKWIEHGDEIIQTKNDLNHQDKDFFCELNYEIKYLTHDKSKHLIKSYRKYSKFKKMI